MKKIGIASALLIGTLTVTNAQSSVTAASTQDASTTLRAVVQDDYKEVKTSELPKAIHDAVAREFKGAAVSKAYKNDKGEFKLIVTTADGAKQTVRTNSKGEWLKKQ